MAGAALREVDAVKVANVIRRFSFEEWGGTEAVVWNCSRHMEELGIEAEILATAALSPTPEEKRDNIPVKRFPYFYPRFPMSGKLRRILDKKGGDPMSFAMLSYLKNNDFTLIHCHSMARLAATCRLAARSANIPYIVTLHGGCYDVPSEELQSMRNPVRHTFNYGRLLDRVLGLNHDPLADADAIVCVGKNEYRHAVNAFPCKIIRHIPNGVDASRFTVPSPCDFRKKHHIPNDATLFLCVSRIDGQKNQLRLVDFIRELRAGGKDNCHCAIIGPVTVEDYGRRLEDAIAAAGLESCFTIIPGLAHDSPELTAAYQQSDVFILPSIHEPFGIVALEAWAAGLPLIAAKTGGLAQLVRHGDNGLLFNPDSTAELLEAYRSLSSQPETAHRLAVNGLNTVREHYTWERVADKLKTLYLEVLDARRP